MYPCIICLYRYNIYIMYVYIYIHICILETCVSTSDQVQKAPHTLNIFNDVIMIKIDQVAKVVGIGGTSAWSLLLASPTLLPKFRSLSAMECTASTRPH